MLAALDAAEVGFHLAERTDAQGVAADGVYASERRWVCVSTRTIPLSIRVVVSKRVPNVAATATFERECVLHASLETARVRRRERRQLRRSFLQRERRISGAWVGSGRLQFMTPDSVLQLAAVAHDVISFGN